MSDIDDYLKTLTEILKREKKFITAINEKEFFDKIKEFSSKKMETEGTFRLSWDQLLALAIELGGTPIIGTIQWSRVGSFSLN